MTIINWQNLLNIIFETTDDPVDASMTGAKNPNLPKQYNCGACSQSLPAGEAAEVDEAKPSPATLEMSTVGCD